MKQEIKEYILRNLLSGRNDTDISSDEDILTGGLIDSIGVMRLIAFIENRFDIVVPPEDMVIENFITLDAINDYIESCRHKK